MFSALIKLGLQPLGDSFRPTGEHYIVALEQELGVGLPADYRQFLADYGVCTFEDYIAFKLPDGDWVDINMFLGNDPDDAYDLRQVWLSLKDHIAAPFLPIATDPFGNAIYLDLNAKALGSVRYWDHETEAAIWVAASFSQFATMLERAP